VLACSSDKSKSTSGAGAERKVRELQDAGFQNARVVDGEDPALSNFKCCYWSCVVDVFSSRDEAKSMSERVKAAGFSAYPKRGWKD